MPRVNHVKSARALYETKPDLDENGEQKTVLVTETVKVYDEETGGWETAVVPKTDRRGNQVVRRLTVRDLDRPKPSLRCDFPGCADPEIRPGQSYKFMALRFRQINRHEEHPDWQHWEYSSSVAAQVARLQYDMHAEIDQFDPTDEGDFDDLRSSLQEQAQEFADERQESVDNMPEALQDGSTAQEYAEAAEEWVGAFDQASAPDAEFYEDCEACDGTGNVTDAACPDCGGSGGNDDGTQCEDCGGTGAVEAECEECDGGKTDTVNEDWVEEAREALRAAVDEAGF